MKVGVQAPEMGRPPQSSTQGEERGQRTEGSYQSYTKDTPKTHAHSILFQKHLIEFLNVFQKQKDPKQR